jgi:hypothetical protein
VDFNTKVHNNMARDVNAAGNVRRLIPRSPLRFPNFSPSLIRARGKKFASIPISTVSMELHEQKKLTKLLYI